MQRFEFLLKNEKTKSYRRIATFLILINTAAFILLAFRTGNTTQKITYIAAAILLFALLFTHLFFKTIQKTNYQTAALCIAIVVWIVMFNWLASVICLMLLLLYRVSVKPLKINVGETSLQYVSFPKRIFKWNELSNVILKDDILTIDFKNNKVFQGEIENGETSINEKEFNDFCRQQLKANQS